jgi:ankyrin repeat protein
MSEKFRQERLKLINLYDEQRVTPLHLAVMQKKIDLIMYLVEYGHACPIIRDKNNMKPMDYSVSD